MLFCINVQFLAIIYVMVYVGAIMVLFLFAIMLLNFREIQEKFWGKTFPIIFFSLMVSLLYSNISLFLKLMLGSNSVYNFAGLLDLVYTARYLIDDINVFQELYTVYGLLLIILAIILTVVMVGSVGLCLNFKFSFIKKR